MKQHLPSSIRRPLAAVLVFALPGALHAAPVIRKDNTDTLNLGTAWVGDTGPGAVDTATWDSSSALANTLGANLTWGGLDVAGASGPVAITGTNTLVAGALNLGANPLSLTTSTANGSLNLSSLAGTGTLVVNNGTANLGLTSLNTANALNFNGTLQLRGGNAATTPGTVGGSFFYLGRAGVSQTPGTAFALDTGAEADGAKAKDVILDGDAWNGKTIHLTSLSGYGALRCDSGSAGTRTVRVDQSADTTFFGLVLSHASTATPNVVRQMVFEKHGSGKLTLAGIVGKQTQSAGAAAADINLAVAGGTLVLSANNTRTGATTVASGATLQVGEGGGTGLIGAGAVTNDGRIVFDHGIGASLSIPNPISGAGSITKKGEGTLAFTGASASFSGSLLVEAGSLRLGPSLGAAAVTVEPGVIISAGLPATGGNSTVGSLMLKDGTESDFRLGVTSDKITVTATGGLTPPGSGETHIINLFNEPLTGGTVTLIDYTGTPLTEAEFGRFSLGILPPGAASYQLANNTANTSIDLLITLEDQVWKGFGDGNWDDTTANWALASKPAVPVPFSFEHPVLFNDSATRFGVVVAEAGVAPLSVKFDNSGNDYTLTGGDIFGTTSLVKNGTSTVELAQPNTYTGGTFVNQGTLRIGNGGETGDIGGGAVVVRSDASLSFVLDDTQLRDYKTTPKMRDVSGGGNITLAGGFTFFNYTGSGVGFDEANSWSNFAGTLTVKGGSEFRTIRNGRTAMGSAQVVLGDAASSGHLAPIEGNWTWTNAIRLDGAANEIRNRAAGTQRTLKLQGVLSGPGGLVFADPAASMTNNQTGFILTGANTLDGAVTINPGVPVRVGGVPGDTDVNQSGAGAGGSLGTATVFNEGTLTFSRSDAHVVSNNISGGGAVFVGLSAGNAEQAMTYSGTASHGGGTTVRAGNLTIAPGGSIGGSSLTIANGATLVIDGTSIGDTTTLNLGASALVHVTGTEVVAALFIGDVQMPVGTYGATGSGAATPDDTRFTGGGVVSVASGPAPAGYTGWAATHAPTGGANDDYDGDGVPNAVEYVLGGTKDGDDLGKLPKVSAPNGNFVVSFVRDQASKVPGVTVAIEVGTNLLTWPQLYDVAAGAPVAVTDNGNGTETVTLTLTRAPDASKFARLKVTVE